MRSISLLSPLALGALATAQSSFLSPAKNVNVTLSEKFPGAKITWKKVNNFCETTPNTSSWSGHITAPKSFIPDAAGWNDDDISGSLYFWYFEARENPDTAPTSIYLGGGPGYSSFDGSSPFPCLLNSDSNSTTVNHHSWNQKVNMLYIDQPFGVGFSHTTVKNGTLNTLDSTFTPASNNTNLPQLNLTTLAGTLEAGGPETVTNTTMSAARTFWRFAQVWFNEFPKRRSEKNNNIAIWAVSYGGLYSPLFTHYTLEQNNLIKEGKHELKNATVLNMTTVGIINGLVDMTSMVKGFADFARNNTYGLPAYSEEVYNEVMNNITAPDTGCYALIDKCKAAVAEGDPDNKGNNDDVNEVCAAANGLCFLTILSSFESYSPYGYFDITYNRPATYPNEYEAALFNQPWVQAELGVSLNYTRGSGAIEDSFLRQTGDAARYDLSYLANLLDSDVAVAMVYGDRDYRCNWISAENASLHIPFKSADSFAKAGYEPIATNDSYQGGLVRQNGKLSFSRVFQAGHSAGGYQPETVSAIFERVMFRRDVATGKVESADTVSYSSRGNASIRGVKSELTDLIENICYAMAPPGTCTEEQLSALADGTAETHNFLVVKPAGQKGERLNLTSGGQGQNNTEENGNGEGSGGSMLGGSFVVSLLPLVALVAMF